jgi:hypothetical protein
MQRLSKIMIWLFYIKPDLIEGYYNRAIALEKIGENERLLRIIKSF